METITIYFPNALVPVLAGLLVAIVVKAVLEFIP